MAMAREWNGYQDKFVSNVGAFCVVFENRAIIPLHEIPIQYFRDIVHQGVNIARQMHFPANRDNVLLSFNRILQ